MGTQPLTVEQAKPTLETVAALVASGDYYLWEAEPGKSSAIEKAGGILPNSNASKVRHYCQVARDRWGMDVTAFRSDAHPSEAELEDLPDGLEVLDHHADANAACIARARKNKMRLIPVRPEPFMLGFVGDPHVDNKCANLHALKRDMETLRAVGARAVNIGDLLDNFHMTGKLARKQASNRMTIREGMAVARWLIRDCGVKWDAHILGNHDQWGEDAYAQMMRQWAREAGSRFYDWEVNLRYQWEGGSFTVCAAHDFKGNSVHNDLHGPMRRATDDGTADLYVAGHRHTAAEGSKENGWRGRKYWFLRVKGYKDFDEYAHTRQFPQQTEGASGAAVINPDAQSLDDRCRLFSSIEAGAEYLQTIRRRAA